MDRTLIKSIKSYIQNKIRIPRSVLINFQNKLIIWKES